MDVPHTFPKLSLISPSTSHPFLLPNKRIHEGTHVKRFLASRAYCDIGSFIIQLNRAVCPRQLSADTTAAGPSTQIYLLQTPPPPAPPSSYVSLHRSKRAAPPPECIRVLQRLLESAGAIMNEAPPDPGPRRFGNVSFRRWSEILEERAGGLLNEVLGEVRKSFGNEGGVTVQDELVAYFLGGFGSAQRLDYGTGHELSFLAFLGCLWKVGFFEKGLPDGEMERSIVLDVIESYLKVIRKLILTYTLEPAGSHGVWGLDDHSFLPYIFGSARLTRPITEADQMPLEGSVKGAPKTGDVVKANIVERERQINMYFSAIGFINDVKKGPFWEHSPILYDVSGVRDGWGKINKGMIKMYNAEVLSKFPVVQHFPFGSLFSWDLDPTAQQTAASVHVASQPDGPATAQTPSTGTAAPWAQATQMPGPTGPGIPYSRAPWAGAGQGATGSRPLGPVPPEYGAAPASGPGVDSNGAQSTGTKAPWAK